MKTLDRVLAAAIFGAAAAVIVQLRRHGRQRALLGVPRVLSWAEAVKRGLA